MRFEHLLHLGGADVLAAADDHVLQATDDLDRAGRVDRGEVAGAEPAVGGERLGGLGGVEIADAHLRSAGEQLAVVVDAHLDLADRVAVGDDRRHLRRSVRALHARAERVRRLVDERLRPRPRHRSR